MLGNGGGSTEPDCEDGSGNDGQRRSVILLDISTAGAGSPERRAEEQAELQRLLQGAAEEIALAKSVAEEKNQTFRPQRMWGWGNKKPCMEYPSAIEVPCGGVLALTNCAEWEMESGTTIQKRQRSNESWQVGVEPLSAEQTWWPENAARCLDRHCWPNERGEYELIALHVGTHIVRLSAHINETDAAESVERIRLIRIAVTDTAPTDTAPTYLRAVQVAAAKPSPTPRFELTRLLSKACEIDRRDVFGRTALHWAVLAGLALGVKVIRTPPGIF